MPSWSTTLGVAPTVGCPARWGQISAAAGHGGRNPSAVAHGGRSPCVVAHDGRTLPSRATTAASPLYKGVTAAAASPPSIPPLNLVSLVNLV
jgi:hypothetical protein